MDKFTEKQNDICDVGGVHCDCCNPYKGKKRKVLNRMARKQLKIDLDKEVKEVT